MRNIEIHGGVRRGSKSAAALSEKYIQNDSYHWYVNHLDRTFADWYLALHEGHGLQYTQFAWI